jgi:hypothetical protein
VNSRESDRDALSHCPAAKVFRRGVIQSAVTEFLSCVRSAQK